MSETKTVTKPPVQASRTHDYLYDPLYSLSSERDHARATFRATTNVSRIRRIPMFRDMFSSLPHYPNSHVQIDVNDPVPSFIPRQWRGYSDQARDALVRYTKFNYDPSVKVPPKSFDTTDVSGRDRYRFFRRPIIPFLQQVPPEVVLQATNGPYSGTDVIAERAPTPLTRNVMVQTDYRDSETQTDPYAPEFVTRPGSQPELLTLATLSYGRGLPAGLAEIEMIERARIKRAWEASLPPLNDLEKLDQRRKMMDEQERKEWAFRESEIEKLQTTKLQVLKKMLKNREEKNSELNTKRLDKLWSRKQQDKEKKFDKIRAEHIKMIRKLTGKQRNIEGKLGRRDVLRDYSDPSSQVYAPLTRAGVFPDRNSAKNKVRSRHLTTYQGLLELEASLPDYVLRPRIQAPKPRSADKGGYVNRKNRRQHELQQVANQLEEAKKPMEPEKPLRFLEKIEKPIPRPTTPSVKIPDQEEEEQELAVVFLQKVIRGRAVQNMMYDGKEKRRELIDELRSTHALQQAEISLKKQEKHTILQLQRQEKLSKHHEANVDEIIGEFEGSCLGDMLDFLSKELVRFQEERRIHAYAMLAERQRRLREAEESGKRQLEERRRREEDEIFKQVIGVHQETVDSYLTNIISGAIEATAEEQARQEVEKMADKINQVAHDIESSRTQLQSEEIVAELVTSFLLPEVEKITMRENVKRNQRKNLLAAHRIIYNESEEAIQHTINNNKTNTTSTTQQHSPPPDQPSSVHTSSLPSNDNTNNN